MHLDRHTAAESEIRKILLSVKLLEIIKKALYVPSQMDSEKVIKSKSDGNWVSTGPHVALKPLDKTNETS